mgnify:CR=1 FL=1
MQTPIIESRHLMNLSSHRKHIGPFLQTEHKRKRTATPSRKQDAKRQSQEYHHMLEVSEMERNGIFDQFSSAKKSSGLKCIAKQVIDIIKKKHRMSYP